MNRVRVRDASWVLVAQVFGKLVAFPAGILLARAIGPSGKGAFSVLQQVTQFSVVVLGLGMNAALLFLAGRREVRGRDAVVLSLVIGSFAVAVMLSAYALVGPGRPEALLDLPQGRLLVAAILLAGPAVIQSLMYQVAFGSGSVRAATMVINASVALQFAAYAVLFLTGSLTLQTAVFVWALSVVGEAVASSALGVRVGARRDVPSGAKSLLQRSYRYALTMWIAGLVGQAALRVDVFLLSALKGSAEVGIYSIAVTFAELLVLLPSALSAVMMPKVSGEGERAVDVTLRLQRVLWPITLLAGVVVALAAAAAVPVLYGPGFSRSIVPLVLLLPGTIAMAATVMPSAYFSGVGLPHKWTIASASNLAVNVLANLLLIPRFGASGAAVSSAISYGVAAALMVSGMARHTGVRYRDVLAPTRADVQELLRAARQALTDKRSTAGGLA